MAFALVTGASGGIGLHLARQLAARGYDLLIVSRDERRLSALATDWQKEFNITVHFLATDLSVPSATSSVLNWASAYDVEILVNNAGFGLWGDITRHTSEEIAALIQLNQVSLTELCRAFVPRLKKRGRKSYILNVASTAAYQAVPFLAVYSASKAYVVSFTRALRWELRATNISVSCLSPGTTSTGFMDRAQMTDELRQKAKNVTMKPEDVASIAIRGLFRGKAEIIPGFINWFSVLLVNIVPKVITERIAMNLYRDTAR